MQFRAIYGQPIRGLVLSCLVLLTLSLGYNFNQEIKSDQHWASWDEGQQTRHGTARKPPRTRPTNKRFQSIEGTASHWTPECPVHGRAAAVRVATECMLPRPGHHVPACLRERAAQWAAMFTALRSKSNKTAPGQPPAKLRSCPHEKRRQKANAQSTASWATRSSC